MIHISCGAAMSLAEGVAIGCDVASFTQQLSRRLGIKILRAESARGRQDRRVSLLTLGIETSGFTGAIALRRNGELLEAVSVEQVGRRHAQTLVSEVDILLRRHALTAKQLEAVAVSIGPGSFTGLRVGVVFAKTLAYAIGCRLVAVDTFRAIALASPVDVTEVFVVSDAQRSDLFVGHYVRETTASDNEISRWTRSAEISIEPQEDWCVRFSKLAESQPQIALSGIAAESLRTVLSSNVRILAPEYCAPQAGHITHLGEHQAKVGDLADHWTLEPFYLRRSAAEEKAAAVSQRCRETIIRGEL